MRSDRVAGLFLALIGATASAEALRLLPIGRLSNPGPAYAPVLIGTLLCGFGVAVALSGSSSPRLPELGWRELPHAVGVLAGVTFAALALEPLGFQVTAFALLAFYLGIAERRPVVPSLAWSAGLTLALHFLFVELLRVPLPNGVLGR